MCADVYAGSRFAVVEFRPSVTIHKKTNSEVVEIIAEDNYSATYNMSKHKFETLNMPFRIVSAANYSGRHRLEYVFQDHHCKESGGLEETPIEGVELLLNGRPFSDAVEYISTGGEVQHIFSMNFPLVRPKFVEQVCYGMVGFTLKLGSL
ncbi:hypothetical protein D1115_03635 [Vibrio alfacsensis]|uniref:Uncharacterized protein n=1 Tax=Vibrio alfacsensis TaxID=1074311 RepID=A0ABM6YS32_9VIBR|nr:hypothetical protein D1115_03635 [Vibrio alfacsensis]